MVRQTKFHQPESLSIEEFYFDYRLSRDVVSPLPVFPAWRDAIVHVTKYLRYVEAGETVRAELALPPGVLRATDGRNCLQLSVQPAESEPLSAVSLRLVDGKFQSDDPELQPRSLTLNTAEQEPVQFRFSLERELPAGKLVLELQNLQAHRAALCVYHIGELPTPVLALRPSLNAKGLLTSQTFRDLFRTESSNTQETVSIRDITFLFTDLKSSTAMYEQIGDAKAYFLVHQHFDALGRVIRNRNGAIVKTIGDAVMAVFDNPVEATSAALEMIEALVELNRTISPELMLKVGIHRGHSMAVTVNEHLDFFGQSVNIAARVQGLADANEVYLTADVYDSPGVSSVLEAHHVVLEEVLVKGVSERLRVHKIAPARG